MIGIHILWYHQDQYESYMKTPTVDWRGEHEAHMNGTSGGH